MDKEKPKKLEGVKHVAFTTDMVKGDIAPPNYTKPKLPTLGYGNESTKPSNSLKERMSKMYSFRRDKVIKIFKDALKEGL